MAEHLDRLRCPFCLEEVQYLDKPKQLKCNHITCLPCLQGHVKVNSSGKNSFMCPVCSEHHEVDALDSLPDAQKSDVYPDGEPKAKRVKINDSVTDDAEATDSEDQSEHRCAACKQEVVLSVCYCVNCDKKLCSHHEQSHNELFDGKDKHKIISIQKYSEKPDLYVKPLCKEHNEILAVCCMNCHIIKCHKCPTERDCQAKRSKQNTHVFITLKDTETRLTSKFSDRLKELSTQVAELCIKEKRVWQNLDDIEEDCKELTLQVEKQAKVLVALVKSMELGLKERISRYERTVKTKAERDMQLLRSHREQLESEMSSCEKFMRESHITKILEKQHSMFRDLALSSSLIIDVQNFPRMDSLRDAVQQLENLDSKLCIEGVHLTSQTAIGVAQEGCIAMSSDGRIIYSCDGELTLQSADMQEWIKVDCLKENRILTGIALYGNDLFIIDTSADSTSSVHMVSWSRNFVEVASKGIPVINAMFEFDYVVDSVNYKPPALSVSAKVCLVTFGDNVLCFNMETGVKTFLKPNRMVSGIIQYTHPLVMSANNYWVVGIVGNRNKLVHLTVESLVPDRTMEMWDIAAIDGLCRWKEWFLSLSRNAEMAAKLRIQNSSGLELAVFTHEMLDYCSHSGGICSNQNSFAVFSKDMKSVMKFKVIFEESP